MRNFWLVLVLVRLAERHANQPTPQDYEPMPGKIFWRGFTHPGLYGPWTFKPRHKKGGKR